MAIEVRKRKRDAELNALSFQQTRPAQWRCKEARKRQFTTRTPNSTKRRARHSTAVNAKWNSKRQRSAEVNIKPHYVGLYIFHHPLFGNKKARFLVPLTFVGDRSAFSFGWA